MSGDKIIGLDAGTTGIRAVLYDTALRKIRESGRDLPQIYPRPGWVEHDARTIRDLAIQVLRDAAGDDIDAVAAIGITNQRETVVAFDAVTGQPLANAVVWQCRRTAAACDELRRRGLADTVRETTGLVLDPYFSASKMRWLLDNVPAISDAARSGTLRFATVDAWLVHALTSGQQCSTDPTNASRTMLFDLDRRDWSTAMLDLFGVRREWLPEVKGSAGSFGVTDPGLVGAAIPITAVLGDQQAALYGQGCHEPGDAKCTYGTGAFLLLNVGNRRIRAAGGLLTTLAIDRVGTPVFALEGAVFAAGSVVQWLRDGLRVCDSAGETESLARSLADNDGVYLVPAFTGLGAPHWDAEARGLICGLTRGSGPAHVARAGLESVAYQVHDLLTLFSREAGTAVAELRVDGGACRNDFLLQFQADVSGLTVSRGADLESTARGVAALAALSSGLLVDPRHSSGRHAEATRFVPRVDAATRSRWLAGWERAVARARL